MARVEPTAEQLEHAWRMRRRPDWPATFEEAMADPLCSRIVRMFACHAALMHTLVCQRPAVVAPTPPLLITRTRPSPLLITRTRPSPPIFDRKRAAAGEREED